MKYAGHRGYKGKATENTRKAFMKAIKEKLDYIEFDIRRTSDHIPVIFHDKKLNRMIEKKKGRIRNYTIEELKALTYKDGQKILTLEECFAYFNSKTHYILDIKDKGIESNIISLIRRFNLEKRTILQTKNKKLLIKLHKIAPDLKYALYRGYMGNLGSIGKILLLNKLSALIFYLVDIKPYPIKYLSSDGPFLYYELTSLLYKKGIKVILGSIKTHNYIKFVNDWKVDIITCNHPENIRNLFENHCKSVVI